MLAIRMCLKLFFSELRSHRLIEPATMEKSKSRYYGVLHGRVVQHGGPELFKGSVEKVVEVCDYFQEHCFMLLVVHEWWVKSFSWQKRYILCFIHVRLIHELLFGDHSFFLGELFFLDNFVFALATHQLTIIKD